MDQPLYIILDLSRSTKEKPVFWKDGDMGYTDNPFLAGRYEADHVYAQWGYYNDGVETIAVPLTHKAMEIMGFKLSWNWEANVKYFDRPKPKTVIDEFI